MSETTPTPTPTPNPAPAPKVLAKRTGLNQAQLRELTKAEQIARAAQKQAHSAALEARKISAQLVTQLLLDVKAARESSAEAIHNTTDAQSATLEESASKSALLYRSA